MKHEIIFTEHYALIVSDEKVEEGSFIYETNVGEVSMVDKWYCEILEKGAKVEPFVKVIAHRPLTDAPILEGVPLLPEFSQEDDVVELALRTYPFGNSERNALITGYNKAKETYKYTEEDLRKAIDMATTRRHEDTVLFFRSDEIIQSLQQPKRPKYFECEMEPKYKHIGAVKGIYGSGFRKQNLMYGLPKTITNSQGQKELVGSYIY